MKLDLVPGELMARSFLLQLFPTLHTHTHGDHSSHAPANTSMQCYHTKHIEIDAVELTNSICFHL